MLHTAIIDSKMKPAAAPSLAATGEYSNALTADDESTMPAAVKPTICPPRQLPADPKPKHAHANLPQHGTSAPSRSQPSRSRPQC